ncbi:P-loop containing nucleoside triphosphate hydrolase protein [Lophiostoma macrostomum CBS 122681]|uniref:DNA 3'-5' helicase n=1 Tax=Lophiostoma macrostomum CBS 122681 TaxID=1314788 RepID=A0A6A6SU70_9PLEO|nr:P-loop containing nucleoside triphosphate hydrolase protein [Lophiostoma macrostomum CBS 122681]
MDDSFHHLRDDNGRQYPGRNVRQYSLTQPQFIAPSQNIAPRDRYRASHRLDDVYDAYDEDGPYEQELAYDSFDQRLLQQPYPDRHRQAARGQARLSLAPKASRYYDDESSTQQPRHLLAPEVIELINPAQFAYAATQPQELSSEPQVGASSSPAFKAGQRRAEHSQPCAPSHPRCESIQQDTLPISDWGTQRRPAARPSKDSARPAPARLDLPHAPPVIQGIPLVFVSTLPDRLRAVFPYPTFNAVQSKCFERVYKSDDNFVLAAPTGSGKTAVLELAICRGVTKYASGQYKIVYQAPIKALCSERQRDWQKRFSLLGLNCVELTGDSDNAELQNVQSADIIVTTPEKWDSLTRKWKDHEKLMRLVKLFLIDEVHILKEDRGATLEAVVSRMKTISTDVRFIALSATVPNFGDVATWLGRNAAEPYELADHENFGEEFRPVRLKKHVCGYSSNSNDFQFDTFLDSKLPEVISKYSQHKPIMIFCFTRGSTIKTAKMLATWWSSNPPQKRFWKEPSRVAKLQNQDLRSCMPCGVAFHHAGLDAIDRVAVEKGFLHGTISVICCTSTLAIGVNLPCHLAIIKNTVTFVNSLLQEYSDLEIMQMIGRAGRPQFDDSAVAVIMTRQIKVRRYESMVTGQETLESKLHLGLIDHLNAEIGLGTIRDLASARKWLTGTFLHVRLKQNPLHYQLEGARSGQDIDEQLDDICLRNIALLQDTNLVMGDERFALNCTDFGDAMTRYYVTFETMRIFMGLQPKAQISEILSALSQASEFKEIRFRSGEKSLYKALNQSPSIRFPIPVNLSLPPHKVSLLIQSVLGAADIVWDKEASKHRNQYNLEAATVLKHVQRLMRCIIDCQISLADSVAIQNALLLQRSLCAKAWDDGPLQMKQLPDVGVVAVRKLVNAGIRTIEELEFVEPHRLEMILGRNPPFGLKLLDRLKSFPKLRVSTQVVPKSVRQVDDGVKMQVKVELGFLNEKPPMVWNGRKVYICLLAESSDGRKLHFARISAPKLGRGQDLIFSALLTAADQSINCFVMCDEVAGTMREASVKPKIAPSMFPIPRKADSTLTRLAMEQPTSNMSRRRTESASGNHKSTRNDDFDDDGIDDDDLVQASFGDLDFDHIENFANPTDDLTRKNTAKNKTKNASAKAKGLPKSLEEDDYEPQQLPNGKWACNHKCKDKSACKHMCCRDGVDKPPKKPARKNAPVEEGGSMTAAKKDQTGSRKTQTKLQLTASKRRSSADIEMVDLTQQEKKRKTEYARSGPKDFRNLHQLHRTIQKKDPPASISSVMHKKPAYCYAAGGEHNLSFLDNDSRIEALDSSSSDYGDMHIDEMSSHLDESARVPAQYEIGHRRRSTKLEKHDVRGEGAVAGSPQCQTDAFDDDNDSLLREAMIGLADSQDIQATPDDAELQAFENPMDIEDGFGFGDGKTTCDLNTPPLSKPLHENKASKHGEPDEHSPFFKKVGQFGLADKMQTRVASYLGKGPTKMASQHEPTANENHVDDFLHKKENMEPLLEEGKKVPEGFKGLEPWLFAEFGDIIELVEE